MKLPGVTGGRLLLGILLPCIPLAIVLPATRGYSWITGNEFYDLGLWPGLVAFVLASFAIVEHRKERSPFLWGFATLGWASVLAYLVCCFRMRWALNRTIVYYFHDINYGWIDWLIHSDKELYPTNLLVLGLFLAWPQLIAATVGGLIGRWAWGTRWTTT